MSNHYQLTVMSLEEQGGRKELTISSSELEKKKTEKDQSEYEDTTKLDLTLSSSAGSDKSISSSIDDLKKKAKFLELAPSSENSNNNDIESLYFSDEEMSATLPGAVNIVPGNPPERRFLDKTVSKNLGTDGSFDDINLAEEENLSPIVKVPNASLVCSSFPEAKAVAVKVDRKKKFRRRMLIGIFLFVVTLIPGILFISRNTPQNSVGDQLKDIIVSKFPAFKTLQNDPKSSQREAFNWLEDKYIRENIAIKKVEVLLQYSLSSFYYSTGGKNWNNNSNWLESENECKWFGVTCSDNCNIIGLEFPNNGLKGTIPHELSLFQSLEELDISENQLEDLTKASLEEIGKLPNMTTLLLHGNIFDDSYNSSKRVKELIEDTYSKFLTKNFPDAEANIFVNSTPQFKGFKYFLDGIVSNKTYENERHLLEQYILATIYYSTEGEQWDSNWMVNDNHCDWDGISCEDSEEVSIMELASINMNSSLPSEFGHLTSLKELNLTRTTLTSNIPTELGLLTALTTLSLRENHLTGKIPTEFGSLTALTDLNLRENFLTNNIPTELGLLTELTVLFLFLNDITGKIPTELGLLTDLQALSVFNNDLFGEIPTEFGQLTNLIELFLDSNDLSGSLPNAFCDSDEYTWLSWNFNDLNPGPVVDCGKIMCDGCCLDANSTQCDSEQTL